MRTHSPLTRRSKHRQICKHTFEHTLVHKGYVSTAALNAYYHFPYPPVEYMKSCVCLLTFDAHLPLNASNMYAPGGEIGISFWLNSHLWCVL